MEREQLLRRIAPCGMLCYTCMGSRDGAFSECSPRLLAYCEGVCEFLGARMPEGERTRFNAFFEEFRETLGRLSGGACHGCRNDDSLKRGCIKGCPIPGCAAQKGVDFCADCGEFPCDKARGFFDEKIGGVWESGSRRIREIGVEAYFEEKKDFSHYLHYKE